MINDVGKKPKYNGLVDCMKKSYISDGLPGLWKGINVNICRSFCINAAELSAYDTVKLKLCKYTSLNEDSTYNHFISSAVTGFCGALASNPADVVKSRYMN